MMVLFLVFLFMPLCATTAGVVVWVGHHDESLDDGALVRKFLIALVFAMALLWAVGRTDAVRMRLDPQFRIETEMDANPVYSAVKRFDPDSAKVLGAFLRQQMSAGVSLPQALLQARPFLTGSVTQRLGFADQGSTMMWGRLIADSLKELNQADPNLCYSAMVGQKLDEQTLAHAFSAKNTERFQQAVVRVYESADRRMRHERPPEDKPANFNEAALEFRAIEAEIEQQFGHSIATQVSKKKLPESPTESAEQMCSARIFQLEQMLKRPRPTASMLIDSVLR